MTSRLFMRTQDGSSRDTTTVSCKGSLDREIGTPSPGTQTLWVRAQKKSLVPCHKEGQDSYSKPYPGLCRKNLQRCNSTRKPGHKQKILTESEKLITQQRTSSRSSQSKLLVTLLYYQIASRKPSRFGSINLPFIIPKGKN